MININDDFFRFVERYENCDPFKLRLADKSRYGFDYDLAVTQIEARKKSKTKLPSWYADRRLLFPSVLSAEQASSELTAAYKQRLVTGENVCDLTGGLGVDALAFSRCVRQVIYVERDPAYAEIAGYNFGVMQACNIRVAATDCRDFLEETKEEFDTYFIDPARRGSGNKRLFALSDCEPDISAFFPLLMEKGKRIILKVSPMVDITQVLGQLPHVGEVHVVSVRNECKELLFVAGREGMQEAEIVCVDLYPDGSCNEFRFFRSGEESLSVSPACRMGTYLYEPNASVLKAGAFKSVGVRYNLTKLEKNSHLYTSDVLAVDFPGRLFEVVRVLDFSGKLLKNFGKSYPAANITVRNFPLTVDHIRKKSGVREGGDVYVFATTLFPDRKVLVVCRKCGVRCK